MLSGKTYPYDRNHSILAFIKSAALDQSKPALIDAQENFDYQSLIPIVASVANQLKALKISQGDRVAILAPPSSRLILLMLGILELGASYVPIDPSYPEERIGHILEDSQPSCLVVSAETDSLVNETLWDFHSLRIEAIDFTPCEKSAQMHERVDSLSLGNDPAYIIYTSGTTGKPKGIVIPHQAISNHMLWMAEEFTLTSEDVFLLKTPLTFDPSVWEIFLPLFLGATLVVAPMETHKNPDKIVDIIEQYKVSILQLVPSILHGFLNFSDLKDMTSLRYIFVGGESLTPSTKKLFFEKIHCPLVNLYGPAEATIDSTFHVVGSDKHEQERNYIGKPIYNAAVYILDNNLMPVKEGEVGELFIGGDGLAVGYLNRPELNDQCFLENPFKPKSKFYKTGDLVKLVDGKLEFIGRVDHQLKINGVRIETNALRDVILSVDENIYDCLFEKQVHDIYQYSTLICYILTKNEETAVDLSLIKSRLKKQFPSYMLPQKYYFSVSSELSEHGKINFNKIKQATKFKQEESFSQMESTKAALFEIWERVLSTKIPDETTGFYELGGDSITSHILSYEISERFSIEFKPLLVLNYDTIEKQHALITQPNAMLSPNSGCLASMNSENVRKLFFVHPIGGTIFWYTHLAKLLDGKVQLYGIQDPEIIDISQEFKTIEEMAICYAELILKEQTKGPFLIGGASFGGTVAIEMARYLDRLGHKIDQVLLLDAWAVYPNELKDIDYFKSSMRRQQKDWVDQFNRSHAEVDFFQDIFNVQLQRLEMLFHYKQKPFPFNVKLFKAQELISIFQFGDSASNYWDQYIKNLEVSVVPGNHETMFLPPNVKMLSDEIERVVFSKEGL